MFSSRVRLGFHTPVYVLSNAFQTRCLSVLAFSDANWQISVYVNGFVLTLLFFRFWDSFHTRLEFDKGDNIRHDLVRQENCSFSEVLHAKHVFLTNKTLLKTHNFQFCAQKGCHNNPKRYVEHCTNIHLKLPIYLFSE